MFEEAVRAAAAPLQVPGQTDLLVVAPAQVAAIAAEWSLPRWQVEAAALEMEIVPLPYLRNLAQFAIRGQLNLLRSAVTVVGSGLPVQKCLQILAAHGVGRLRVLVPERSSVVSPESSVAKRPAVDGPARRSCPGASPNSRATDDPLLTSPIALAAAATNQNAAVETSAAVIDLRRGDPVSLLAEPGFPAGAWVVAACLEDAADEMLMQVACKRRAVPLVLAGLQDDLGQAVTILPGDLGVPLIYQADHPHLERSRPGSLNAIGYQGRVVGAWLADQVIALRLGLGELLQNRLLYADMKHGRMQTFPLGR